MSLRALKKREISSNPYKKHPVPLRTRKLIETKPNNILINKEKCKSLPDLTIKDHNIINRSILNDNSKLLSKSDTDLMKLIKNSNNNGGDLINAKSEVCLKTISVHKTVAANSSNNLYHQRERINNSNYSLNGRSDIMNNNNNNNNNCNSNRNNIINHNNNNRSTRRMSGQSLSIYSNRSNSMINNDYDNRDNGFIDTSCILHIPIIGYEVMEERARFTVYKLRVENPFTNDCWLVLRRYTDFVRLNNKLKQSFPLINLQLPRKKLFGDNFNTVFLDNRVQGLQMFVNSIMAKDELRNSKIVRDFFCLDEPPTYSESMEECRAIFEAQEETIAHLKMQISNKNDTILSLQQRLSNEIAEKEQLKMAIKNTASAECSHCSILLSKLTTQ